MVECMVEVACALLYGLGLLPLFCEGVLRPPEVLPWPMPRPPLPRPSVTSLPHSQRRLDLRGRQVTVVMKDTFTSRPIEDSVGYQRFRFRDGYIFDTFQQLTGFIPIVIPPTRCAFGNSSSSSCSSTDDVSTGVAAMTFNTDFVGPEFVPVDWGPVLHYGYSSVVTARGDRYSALAALTAGVEMAAMAALVAAVVSTATAWTVAAPKPRPPVLQIITKVLALIVSYPTYNSQPISSYSVRILYIACCFFSIVFVCFVQGVLVDNMTNIRFEQEIDTLQELDDSNIDIITVSDFYAGAFQGSDSDLLNRLNSKIKKRLDLKDDEVYLLDLLAQSKDFAVLLTQIAVQILAPITKHGPGSLHELSEHPSMYFMAHPNALGSPYTERLGEITGWLLQSGIINIWFEESKKGFVDVFRDNMIKKGIKPRAGDGDDLSGAKTIRLNDFVSIFLLLAYLYGIAWIVLLVEVAVARDWARMLWTKFRSLVRS